MAEIEMQMEKPTKKPSMAPQIVLYVVLAAIVFGAGGYYLGTKQSKSTTTVTASTTPIPATSKTTTAVASTTATTDVTANWKTYTNTPDGYLVKYPADWFVEYSVGQNSPDAKVSDAKNLYISSSKVVPCTDFCAPGPYDSVFHISASNISADETLDIAFNKSFGTLDGVNKTPITIGSQPGYKGVVSCQKNEGEGCDNPEWFTIYNGKLYTFNSGLSYKTTDDTILSTFQFTK